VPLVAARLNRAARRFGAYRRGVPHGLIHPPPCVAKYPCNYEAYAVVRTLLYPLNMKNLIKTALLVILGY
jgi:hypothetical protein